MIEPITEHHTVIRPTMVPTLKVPGNKGTEVIMVATNFNSEPEPGPGPEYADLAMSDPVVTGEAVVGETLTCAEPTVTGGSGDHEFTYTWKLVQDAGVTFGTGSSVVVPAAVIGKQGYCEVAVLDATADDSISKDSNVIGPVEEPEFDDLAVADGKGSNWLGSNVYVVGETVEGKTAEFTGGKPPVTYRYRFQTQAEGSDSWTNKPWTTTTNAKNSVFFELVEPGKVKFQSQARDANNPIVQLNSTTGTKTVTAPIVYDPLVVGDPVATGDPFVGYTLTCSEPSVDGGSGDVQIDYFWVDESNAMVWENTYMSNTCKVIDYDLGKTMKCLVSVTDKATGENTTVSSNQLGPINRPTLPEYEVYVNSELYDDPSQQINVLPNGSVVCEVRPETVSNPPLDLAYEWKIRTGTGRLSGDKTATGIIYMAPDAAPAGAALNCTVTSRDANNNAFAAEITILVSDEGTRL